MASIVPTDATAIGGRAGWVGSSNAALRVKLSPNPDGVTPEVLMAAGVAASFIDVMRRLAPSFGHTLVAEANVTARVYARLDADDPGPALRVTLLVDLADVPADIGAALAMAAKAACPYTRTLDLVCGLEIQIS